MYNSLDLQPSNRKPQLMHIPGQTALQSPVVRPLGASQRMSILRVQPLTYIIATLLITQEASNQANEIANIFNLPPKSVRI